MPYRVILLLVIVSLWSRDVHPETVDGILVDEVDLEEIFEDIPVIDFGRVSQRDIADLPSFSPEGAHQVIAYRDSLGDVDVNAVSVDAIPGLTALERLVLEQALGQHTPVEYPEIRGTLRSGVIHRPDREEPEESKYYIKCATTFSEKLTGFLIGERDPFEPRVMDNLSASLVARLDENGTRLVLGDYRPAFGQRLLFSRYTRNYVNGADAFFSEPSTVENTFFEESGFLRGGHFTFDGGAVSLGLWTSRRHLDANLDDAGEAVTIRTTGLHTGGERGNLTETLHAAQISLRGTDAWHLEVLGMTSAYAPALSRESDERSFNKPDGARFSYLSASGGIDTAMSRFFFEHVVAHDKEHASVVGLQMRNERVKSCLVARDYSAGYWALRAAGINSFGQVGNERGIYAGLGASLTRRISADASFDLARTVSRTPTVPMPRSRQRMAVELRAPVTRTLSGSVTYRSVREHDGNGARGTMKIAVDGQASRGIPFDWRFIAAGTWGGGEQGIYGECGLTGKLEWVGWKMSAGLFAIPSYDARYYRYEQDVPGRGLTRPVWGDGGSFISVVTLGALSARYRYLTSDETGSGSEVTVQSDIRF